MNISIRDEQGLGIALMMDGYSQAQIIEARQTIQRQFKSVAITVFQEILREPLPCSIIVNLVQNDNDELLNNKAARLASFYVNTSHADNLHFNVHEVAIKHLLNNDTDSLSELKSTVIHEMFHAADRYMLENNRILFSSIGKNIETEHFYGTMEQRDALVALIEALKMFDHYRAEGIAVLGSHLLMNKKLKLENDASQHFFDVFRLTLMKAQFQNFGQDKEFINSYIDNVAYLVAPTILMMIIGKTDMLKLDEKIPDKEIALIMRTAINLSLPSYIKGLICLGDKMAPIEPFLRFCSMIQFNNNEDDVKAFSKLVQQPESADRLRSTIRKIMGCLITENELDEYFYDYIQQPLDNSQYPQMKEKLQAIYHVMKTDTDPNRKTLAQWALTYFFDEEDLINDNIPGIGYIDDMIIIDYAINILNLNNN